MQTCLNEELKWWDISLCLFLSLSYRIYLCNPLILCIWIMSMIMKRGFTDRCKWRWQTDMMGSFEIVGYTVKWLSFKRNRTACTGKAEICCRGVWNIITPLSAPESSLSAAFTPTKHKNDLHKIYFNKIMLKDILIIDSMFYIMLRDIQKS